MERLRRSSGHRAQADGAASSPRGWCSSRLTTRLPECATAGTSRSQLSLILLMMVCSPGSARCSPSGWPAPDSALVLRAGLLLGSPCRCWCWLPRRAFSWLEWRRTAWRWASWTPPPTCRRSRSSTTTGGRCCRPSTACGPRRHRRLGDHALDQLGALQVGGRVALRPSGGRLRPVPSSGPWLIDPDAQAVAEAVPWRPLLLVGARPGVFYMVDTAASTWGPTYLDDFFDTPSGSWPWRRCPISSPASRCGSPATPWSRDYGGGGSASACALVAFGALGVTVLAPTWQIAVPGLHGARTRRRRDRAAGLLGGRRARRGDVAERRCAAGAGRCRDRPLERVQLRRRAAGLGAERAGPAPARCASAPPYLWRRCPCCCRSRGVRPRPRPRSRGDQRPVVEVEQHPVGVLPGVAAQRHRLVAPWSPPGAGGGRRRRARRSRPWSSTSDQAQTVSPAKQGRRGRRR